MKKSGCILPLIEYIHTIADPTDVHWKWTQCKDAVLRWYSTSGKTTKQETSSDPSGKGKKECLLTIQERGRKNKKTA